MKGNASRPIEVEASHATNPKAAPAKQQDKKPGEAARPKSSLGHPSLRYTK